MGGNVPSDSISTGTINIIAGSLNESGTVRLLTRGLNACAEDFQTPSFRRALSFSQGQATEVASNVAKMLPLESGVGSQCIDSPLVLLVQSLNDPDTALQYIGQELLGNNAALHIRFWNTFASQPELQHLAKYSIRDVWIDVGTSLPMKLSYVERSGGDSAPAFPMDTFFSDFRTVGTLQYPFSINRSLNGTPWITARIQNIRFNTGLTSVDFPVGEWEP